LYDIKANQNSSDEEFDSDNEYESENDVSS